MNRREFVQGAGAAAALVRGAGAARRVYASPAGHDGARGRSRNEAVRTVEAALRLARGMRGATIELSEGIYELAEPVRMGPEDSGMTVEAQAGARVMLSGGTTLRLAWRPFRDGIWSAEVPAGTTTDQLFVNGERQVLARYPKFDASARYLNGTAADALSAERVARWKDPRGAMVHAMQRSLWGSLHYRVTGKNADGTLAMEGGWQVDRDQPRNPELVFVEGVFEELTAPGEWFLDEAARRLYYMPPAGVRLDEARVEVVRLERLVELDGARDVTLRGLCFGRTLRTFMKTREQVARSDWRIARTGAVFAEGTAGLRIEGCEFDQVGGNAVFVSGRNRGVRVTGCHVHDAGASGICFVGRPAAQRGYLAGYEQTQELAGLDRVAGPKSADFPAECVVEECLIARTGRVEKQTAGVEIDLAQRVTVRNCSIYGVPRAGVNMGDGAFGGHVVDGCDVFDTVLETSDHGAFNAWGRDRWWHLRGLKEDEVPRELAMLDAVETNVLTRTRWACEHGWDIDLDDGSTNYRIERNLCLSGGIKLREGFGRTVRDNVTVNNTLHVHVWPAESGDVVERNVVWVPYRAVRPRGWGTLFDCNFLHTAGAVGVVPARALQALSGQDVHSLAGDALFRDAAWGDYTLRERSPARGLGIATVPTMFGVRLPRLRALARTPDLARLRALEPATLKVVRRKDARVWMGATVRNLVGLGEMSELGAPTERGVVMVEVPEGTAAARAGLLPHDLLVAVNGREVADTEALERTTAAGARLELQVLRKQQPVRLLLVR